MLKKTKIGFVCSGNVLGMSHSLSYSLGVEILPYNLQFSESCPWHLSNIVERRLKRE